MENKSGHSSVIQNSLSKTLVPLFWAETSLAAGSRKKGTVSPTWRQRVILKIWLQGEMVRVIKLSMKCTLIRAFCGRHGRKKPKGSVEGARGFSPPCQGGASKCQPSVLSHRAAVAMGQERGERRSKGYLQRGCSWGGKTHCCPVSLKPSQPASWMSRELCIHRTPVHQYGRLDSGLGAFPAPGSWFLPLAQPFSTLHPAAAHPPRGICFPSLKTKLPGG